MVAHGLEVLIHQGPDAHLLIGLVLRVVGFHVEASEVIHLLAFGVGAHRDDLDPLPLMDGDLLAVDLDLTVTRVDADSVDLGRKASCK